MVVFNSLVPALFLNLTVQNIIPIGNGSLSTGGTLVLGHIESGTLVSEPGFETAIDATISYANDWPTSDPDGKHGRPDLRGLVTTHDHEYLEVLATGIQTPIPQLGAIITGASKDSLPFGSFQSVFIVSFRTGAAKYKNLEDSIFVASETVKALGGGYFRAGLRISKLYSTKTDVTLQ
ncbi:hypothetical protein MMC21_000077 [Puttea exsequens]|nr:hypothetical protein [Puttea exsequens]